MLIFYVWKRILEIIWFYYFYFKRFGIFERNCLGLYGELVIKLGLEFMFYDCILILRNVSFLRGNLFYWKFYLNDDNI